MSYVTQEDFVAHFGIRELTQLTDRDARGAVDEEVLQHAIDAADRLIGGYISGVVTLPLVVAVPLLTDIGCAIVRRRLYTQIVPEVVQTDYLDAIARLKDIQAGRLLLGLDEAGDEAEADYTGISIDATDRQFTAETLSDY